MISSLLLALFAGYALADAPDVVGTDTAAPHTAAPEPAAMDTDTGGEDVSSFPGLVTPDTPHYDLELLYHDHEFARGLEITRARLAATPDDPHLYVHAVRFMFELGEEEQRDSTTLDKKEWYEEMVGFAEQGLVVAPDDPHLFFAVGIAKARLGTTRGVLASLFMAKDIEQAWLDSIATGFHYSSLGGEEQLPCDSHTALGIFYRLVPEWWIVKAISGTRGDLDKSHAHLLQADTCSPNDVGILKELGVTQLCIGTKRKDKAALDRGRATLEHTLTVPINQPTDEIDMVHIERLLDDPSLACEYSRDGQQELDEAVLEE